MSRSKQYCLKMFPQVQVCSRRLAATHDRLRSAVEKPVCGEGSMKKDHENNEQRQGGPVESMC